MLTTLALVYFPLLPPKVQGDPLQGGRPTTGTTPVCHSLSHEGTKSRSLETGRNGKMSPVEGAETLDYAAMDRAGPDFGDSTDSWVVDAASFQC